MQGVKTPTKPRAFGLAALIASASLLVLTHFATAMVVVQRDFPELVARAEQIVVGTVSDITESVDSSGMPATFVTFSDLTVLKGDAGATLTLRFAGGRADGYAVHVSDMPTFALGEQAVLFVAGNGRDVCPLVGVWQGRFRVRLDAERGTEVIDNHEGKPVIGLAGRKLHVATRRAEGSSASEPSASSPAVTLDEFRQLIADEMAHPQAATSSP